MKLLEVVKTRKLNTQEIKEIFFKEANQIEKTEKRKKIINNIVEHLKRNCFTFQNKVYILKTRKEIRNRCSKCKECDSKNTVRYYMEINNQKYLFCEIILETDIEEVLNLKDLEKIKILLDEEKKIKMYKRETNEIYN